MKKIDFVPVFVRSGNNYDMAVVSDETGLKCGDESRTQQNFKEECDINTIVRRFGVTGQVPTNVRAPLQQDFVDALDFRQSMDALVAAQRSFEAMPSSVRKRFGNDPGAFVEFCSDPANRAEAERLGLLVPPPPEPVEPPPMAVKIVSDPLSKGKGGEAP